MQAHTSGEVGILGTVLLRVYSRTILAIFIEIGLYLTDKEQKISWHSFLRHGVFANAIRFIHSLQTDGISLGFKIRQGLPRPFAPIFHQMYTAFSILT